MGFRSSPTDSDLDDNSFWNCCNNLRTLKDNNPLHFEGENYICQLLLKQRGPFIPQLVC